jgi:ribosome-associated protein
MISGLPDPSFQERPTITTTPRKASPTRADRRRSLNTACRCAQTAEDMKGKDTIVLDLTEVTAIVDYFVITTGTSGRQMQSVADEIQRTMRSTTGSRPRSVEGQHDANWILEDFGDIVLHVFSPEARKLYDLEHLWADAPRIDWKAELDRTG